HAHRHLHRPRHQRQLPARLPDDARRQRRLRQHQRGHPDLHGPGGAHGARVHVQQLHAQGEHRRRAQRVRPHVLGRGADGAVGEVGV
ncbi:hypothetical protein LTR16_009202, partial [Cryomyces antarcticus]